MTSPAIPSAAKGFAALARYKFSFDLQAYPGQFAGVAGLVARHPDIPVIINHAGMPVDTDEEGREFWRKGLMAFAASPHVAIKLSGVGFIHRHWTVEQIRPYLLEAIDIFGTKRWLFSWPATFPPYQADFGKLRKTSQSLAAKSFQTSPKTSAVICLPAMLFASIA